MRFLRKKGVLGIMSELTGVERIHLLGIGGSGMSSLARLLSPMAGSVSGCDLERGACVEALEAMGVSCAIGHSPEHIERFDPQLVVYSSAIAEDCGELAAARRRGVRTAGRGEALSWLFNEAQGVGVAGTHGKTTTSSMIGLILDRANLSPTLYVGAEVRDIGTNARLGDGPLFVAELDESDGSFEYFHPSLAVVTNIDWDHVDHFRTREDVVAAFVRFAGGLKAGAPLVVCAEDEGVQSMLEALSGAEGRGAVLRYGWGRAWDWGAFDVRHRAGGGVSCRVCRRGEELGCLEMSVSGEHNVLNALAALAASDALGVPFAAAAETLRTFRGAKRRLQVLGSRRGVLVVDDYAHHPAEVAASLGAMRKVHPDRRLVAVFQPHRYSRTAAFQEPLAAALGGADLVLLLPVYGAGEAAIPSISSQGIADRMRADGRPCRLCGDEKEALAALDSLLEEGDVLLTLGAGSVSRLGGLFLSGTGSERGS